MPTHTATPPAPINVALVGYGLAGKAFHAPLIDAADGLRLAMVVSSDAAKVQADWPGMAVVADMAAALADPAIGLMVLATPDALHAPQAMAALDAGKHVVIDKPFAPTLAQARMVADKARETGATLTIFQNRRWDADLLTIKALLANGELGDVVQFESHFDRFRPQVTHRWKDTRDAGIWQDLGPHLVDQAVHLFGMPLAVMADMAVQRAGGTVPDYAHVTLRYATRRIILHISLSAHASALRFAVHGTNGSYIKYGLDPQEDQSKAGLRPADAAWGVDPQPGTLVRVGADGTVGECAVPSQRGDYPAFYAAVRDAIWGVGPNPVPPQQALEVMTVLEAACTSAAQGREIRF
ncbi:MAG: oxidoreductase [Sphingopyxis sp.]